MMSNTKKPTSFSSQTAPLEGPPGNPAVFPLVMLGTASFLGGMLYFGGAEGALANIFGTNAVKLCTVIGTVSITAAHGYSMVINGNARKEFHVPHPKSSDQVPYLNATRGYYNFVEHMPFFLMNFMLARESSPCIAGLAAGIYGIGRILYTQGYAYQGPKARTAGFMLATFSSMACLGVMLFENILN